MEISDEGLRTFKEARPFLLGLAYRLLGARSEAEDVVQDTFLKWMSADHSTVTNPRGWLTTVCTRQAIDALRSARCRRERYVGEWLPEPLVAVDNHTPEDAVELDESLTTAFLLTLERLGPKERAAFLLHEVFSVDYGALSAILDVSQNTCRKLVSRARANIAHDRCLYPVPVQKQIALTQAFKAAIYAGDTTDLMRLLAKDVILVADSGGKIAAPREPITGLDPVLAFIRTILSPAWRDGQSETVYMNGQQAFVMRKKGALFASVSFGYDEGEAASRIYIVRNPEKLVGRRA